MVAVLSTLTRGNSNKFLDYPYTKVRIAVLPWMEVKTCWNPTQQLLEWAYWLRAFAHVWLKNWDLPSYSRKCLLYRLRWHLVIKMNSLTVKQLKSASWYHLLLMWRHVAIRHWSCLIKPTDYKNSPTSGCRIQHIVNPGHSSQHRMNGPLSSTSWKCWGHSNTGYCRCRTAIWSHFAELSPSTKTCSIMGMVLWEL